MCPLQKLQSLMKFSWSNFNWREIIQNDLESFIQRSSRPDQIYQSWAWAASERPRIAGHRDAVLHLSLRWCSTERTDFRPPDEPQQWRHHRQALLVKHHRQQHQSSVGTFILHRKQHLFPDVRLHRKRRMSNYDTFFGCLHSFLQFLLSRDHSFAAVPFCGAKPLGSRQRDVKSCQLCHFLLCLFSNYDDSERPISHFRPVARCFQQVILTKLI